MRPRVFWRPTGFAPALQRSVGCSECSRLGVIMTSGPMSDDQGLLTEEEAAAILRLSLPAVRQLRLEGAGPPHVEIGRQTRYRQAVVQGWLAGEGQRSSAADNR
jgi:predicted DNA-binding transcriptional regulator AlpA